MREIVLTIAIVLLFVVTVLVDGEEVELAEVEIGENAEVTVEEEMVVKDDDEDDDMGGFKIEYSRIFP